MLNKNTQTDVCCEVNSFIKNINESISSNIKEFTSLLTKESKSNREGYSFVKNEEIFKQKNGFIPKDGEEDFEKEKGKNQENLKILLNSNSTNNQKLAKCLEQLSTLTSTNLSYMCLKNPDELFNKDFSKIKLIDELVLNIQDVCHDYLKQYNFLTNNILNSYIDSVNSFITYDKCNYYSSFFNFDVEKDTLDPLFPTEMLKYYTESLDDFEATLNKWDTCSISSSYFKSSSQSTLKSSIERAATNNPNGLSTYIGRYDIEFDIIKETFYVDTVGDFHITCENKTCTAECKSCDTLVWENKNVLKNSDTKLDVSCCNKYCTVYVSIIDNNMTVEGAEIFVLRSSKDLINVDDLLYSKLSYSADVFDNKEKGYTIDSSSKSYNSEFVNQINDIINNNSNYIIDYRLKDVYNLNLTVDGKVKTLKEYVNNELIKSNSTAIYFNCFDGSCYESISKDNSEKVELGSVIGYPISANNDEKVGEDEEKIMKNDDDEKSSNLLQTKVIAKPRSSSKSTSSKSTSSKSSTSSTSTKTGSSLTGGSSSSSTSTKTGSSLTGGSSSSSTSTKTGSSLTGGSSSTSKNTNYNPSYSNNASKLGSPLPAGYKINQNNFNNWNSLNTSTNSKVNYNNNNYFTSYNQYQNSRSTTGLGSHNKVSTYFNSPNYSTSNSFYVTSNKTAITYTQRKSIYVSTNYRVYYSDDNYYYNSLSSYNYNYFQPRYSTISFNRRYYRPYSYTNRYLAIRNYKSYTPVYCFDFNYPNCDIYYYSQPAYLVLPYLNFWVSRLLLSLTYYVIGVNPYYFRPVNNYYLNASIASTSSTGFTQLRTKLKQTNYSQLNLKPEYDPIDWLPNYSKSLSTLKHVQNINSEIANIKITIQCESLVCLTLIQGNNLKDGYENDISLKNKNRVFVDFVLRKIPNFKSEDLSLNQKKCIITTLLNKNTTDIYDECNITNQLNIFPLKKSCFDDIKTINNTPKFKSFFNRFTSWINEGTKDGEYCVFPQDCRLVDTKEQKLKCGLSLIEKYTLNGVFTNYSNIMAPCFVEYIAESASNAPIQNLIQMNSKLRQENLVISYSDLSAENQAQVKQSNTSNSNEFSKETIIIDGSTQASANTNIDEQINLINTVTESTDDNYTTSNSSIMKSSIIYICLSLLLLIS